MREKRRSKIGLALAGGGPLGSIYEIGALVALQEALVGADLAKCDVYVGVSAGAFITAGLANGFTPRDLCAKFIESETHDDPFEPEILLRPAIGEYARRLASLPFLAFGSMASYADWFGASYTSHGFFEALQRFTRALPNGIFDNSTISTYLARLFDRPGRTNDFRKLAHKLFIVATDLDRAEAVVFGAPGYDDVPISEAVKASSALPGLYPPARIGGRDYVDGALKKTLHASVALKAGARLLFCINPLTPFDAPRAAAATGGKPVRLAEEGLVTVLSQTFRALIQSRMQVGMDRYAHEFPGADILLFEPAREDALIFFANVFSYSDRKRLAEHAYRHTRSELRRRAAELEPVLARHGLRLDHEILADPDRRLTGAPPPSRGLVAETGRLGSALGRLENALAQGAPGGRHGNVRHREGTRHGAETEEANAREDT
jgi:NTE family protein